MNRNFTEIKFIGNIDEYLARCEKMNRRLNIIRASLMLGALVGICLCRISLKIGMSVGTISALAFYISIHYFSICDYSDLLEKVKDDKFIGVEFRKSYETKENHCNLTLYTEEVTGDITPVTVPSVRVRVSTKPKYQNTIEINLVKTFEITHYFYDNLTYNTVLSGRLKRKGETLCLKEQ